MSRALPQVKNRAPAPIQISAEQLIKEAQHRGLEDVLAAPKQYIADSEELIAYQLNKRKDFESQVQRHRAQMGIWSRYALWEASLKEFDRARSIFERALQFNYKDEMTWAKYGEMEMKAKFVNHARNVWDRATTLLPRIDQFWYKYTYMEELVAGGGGNMDLTRNVFERWMQWEPEESAWTAYIKFEMRQGNITNARGIYERFVLVHTVPQSYIKYARWEEKNGDKARSREVYEKAVEVLGGAGAIQGIYAAFGQFEERCQEHERARQIYRYAIEDGQKGGYMDENKLSELRTALVAFEKRHGSKAGIEEVILRKRREQYEDILSKNTASTSGGSGAGGSHDYNTWLDLAQLEEAEGESNAVAVRAVYERAVLNVPPVNEKPYWRRYIYLYICWALYEELICNDLTRAREVYRIALACIPHTSFTFSKVWFLAAELEIRRKDLTAARKLLGMACGKCASLQKPSLYRKYIALETQMGEVERCRNIYTKWLETIPENCDAWTGLAQLEASVGEDSRARAVYELAVSQSILDSPEYLWKCYIDFECDEGQTDNVRKLYARLLELTQHVRVWIASAIFEVEGSSHSSGSKSSTITDADFHEDKPLLQLGGLSAARVIFQQAYTALKAQGLKEERVTLLNSWRDLELRTSGGNVTHVESKMPRKIKVKRAATSVDDGTSSRTGVRAMEEDYDYIFPDDEHSAPGIKLLENALKWKAAAAAAAAAAMATASKDVETEKQEEEEGEGEEQFQRKRKTAPTSAEELDIDDL